MLLDLGKFIFKLHKNWRVSIQITDFSTMYYNESFIKTINHTGIKYQSYFSICICKVIEECSWIWTALKFSWIYFNRTEYHPSRNIFKLFFNARIHWTLLTTIILLKFYTPFASFCGLNTLRNCYRLKYEHIWCYKIHTYSTQLQLVDDRNTVFITLCHALGFLLCEWSDAIRLTPV